MNFLFRYAHSELSDAGLSEQLNKVRSVIEGLLPEVVVLSNNLSDGDLKVLYKPGQDMVIDDYDFRLDVYKFIVNPSEDLVYLFEEFRKIVKIV